MNRNSMNSVGSSPSVTEAVATELKEQGLSRDMLDRRLADTQDKQALIQEILKKLEEKHPDSPELHNAKSIESALQDVRRVLEQKKSFLGSAWETVKGALGKVGEGAKWSWNNILKPTLKSPIFWTIVAGLLLYFFFQLPAPPGPGDFRHDLIGRHQEVIEKIGTQLPEASTEAISRVAASGGSVSHEALNQAREILQSPSLVAEQGRQLQELTEQMQKLSQSINATPR